MPVGRREKIARPPIRFPADYFDRLLAAQEDVLGSKVLAGGREPAYGELAGYLAPLESYTLLGDASPAPKFIVYPDGALGTDRNRTSRPLAERLVFDPATVVPRLEPAAQKPGYELCAQTAPGGSHAVGTIRVSHGTRGRPAPRDPR